MKRTFLVIAMGQSLIGCGPSKGDDSSSGTSDGGDDVLDVTVSEVVPTVATVRWTTSTPSLGTVTFAVEGGEEQPTTTETEATTEHEIVVFGMKAYETYTLRAYATDTDGQSTLIGSEDLTLDAPPSELPRVTVSEYDPDATAPGGYVLTTLIQPTKTWVVIIDRDGDPVWWWPLDDDLSAGGARFDAATNSIYYLQADALGEEDLGEIVRVTLDGTEAIHTRALLGHHDAVRLPSGEMAFASFDFREMKLDTETHLVAGDSIFEIAEGATDDDTPEPVFATLDAYPAVYVPCGHFYEEVYRTGAYDFSHINSLMYDQVNDRYFALARNLDSILVIDREDPASFQQIGGLHADVDVEDSADTWSHPHMSHIWDGGFMVHDNGYHHEPIQSRIAEYAFDEDAGTLELVWEWTDEDDFFNPFFGDAQKLGDTYLGSWTAYGRLQEITQDGTVVWRAETDAGTAVGRAIWTNDLYDLSDVWTF